MLENLIAVELDPYMSGEDSTRNMILSRWVSDSFLERNYADLIKYLLDPEPDSNNKEGYNLLQRETVTMIRGWMEEAKRNADTLRIDFGYTSNNVPSEKIWIANLEGGLNRQIGMDRDSLVHTVDMELEGKPTQIRTIKLWAERNSGGGLVYPINC